MSEQTKSPKVKKPFYKRVWVWVLAIIVVIMILPSAEEEPTTTVSKPADKAEKAEQAEPEVKPASIGDALKVGNVVFTVHGKESTDTIGDQYLSQKAQGKYLVLDVSVKNEGKEAITVNTSFFKLISGETEYDSDGSADMYINDANTMFFLQEINPGNELRGKIAFDVNDEVINGKDTLLNVQTGAWGTEQGQIKIGG